MPDGLPTMPQMISAVLGESTRPLEPREITDVIRQRWWPEADGLGHCLAGIAARLFRTSSHRLPRMKPLTIFLAARFCLVHTEATGFESQPRDGGMRR